MPQVDEERLRRIGELVRRLEELPDPEGREIGRQLLEEVLELHGAGIERMMEIVFDTGEFGQSAIRRLAGDDLVSSLLVLHGLHPDDLETRVAHALGQMHGNAELMSVLDGVVRVRLTSSGCGARASVEAALKAAAPDAVQIVIEDGAPVSGFVPLGALGIAGVPKVAR